MTNEQRRFENTTDLGMAYGEGKYQYRVQASISEKHYEEIKRVARGSARTVSSVVREIIEDRLRCHPLEVKTIRDALREMQGSGGAAAQRQR